MGIGDASSGRGAYVALLLGLQLVMQAGIFVSLFVIMFDTYPFRVGLMGELMSQHLAISIVISLGYLLATAVMHAYRMESSKKVSGHEEPLEVWEIWDLPGYLPLSALHKIVATVYYVINFRAAVALGDPVFYNKEAWLGLYLKKGMLTSMSEKRGEEAVKSVQAHSVTNDSRQFDQR